GGDQEAEGQPQGNAAHGRKYQDRSNNRPATKTYGGQPHRTHAGYRLAGSQRAWLYQRATGQEEGTTREILATRWGAHLSPPRLKQNDSKMSRASRPAWIFVFLHPPHHDFS